MTVRRTNVTIPPDVYEKFIRIAERQGIRVSTWVTAKMKEFIEFSETKPQ